MDKKDLYNKVIFLGRAFDKSLEKDTVIAYVENLHQYSEKQINEAFSVCIRNKKYFPKIAEIIEILDPQATDQDRAQILADNIIETVLRFGRYQAEEINAALSPNERYALMAIGGIESICNIQNDQLATVRAQLRNSCKASLVKEKIDLVENKKLENRRGLHKLEFSDYPFISNKIK